MASTDKNRFFLPAWGASLTLHGVVLGLAFALLAQVKPVLPEDVHKWNVALVETAESESRPEQVQSAVTPEQPPARIVPPSRMKRVPETYQAVRPVTQQVEPLSPTIEPVRPTEQKVEIPQLRDEPVEQRIAKVAESKTEPVVEAKESAPAMTAVAPEPMIDSQPVQDGPVAVASAPTFSPQSPVPQEVIAPVSAPDSPVDVAPVQAAKTSSPATEGKEDHRWLAESLWRRVAELKRYPNSARMNGQEGKVVLKAVIRSDGHLADVFVQKSSGYSALDAAAIEAVKLACPLYMKQALGKAQIVVSLPIVYSLAN
ncbi:MAG: energy transducer TonB [Nitrospira sp.]|nr:energy transducer TonB [Nitrospira sp. BO4]